MGEYDYLEQAAMDEFDSDDGKATLEKLVEYVALYKERQERVNELENALKEAKRLFNDVSQNLIPGLLAALGIDKMSMADGSEVSYKTEVSVSVKDYTLLEQFLMNRGDEDLMKTALDVGRVPGNVLADMIKIMDDKYGIMPDVKQGVHPATLKSYFTRLLGFKKGVDAEMQLAEVNEDMVTVFTFNKTTIKEKK